MGRGMKYIMFDGHLHDVPVIFPQTIEHATMRTLLSHIGPVLSAGFVDVDQDGVRAHGRSHSLGVDSRPEDTTIIQRFMES